MIQPHELRIGNWIEIRPGDRAPYFHQVTGHDIETIDEYPEGFEGGNYPIPLTPEILEAARFEMYPDWNDERKEGSTAFLELGYLFLASGMMSHSVTLCDNDRRSTGVHVVYLHQLQNLFHSLTGKELEINLK